MVYRTTLINLGTVVFFILGFTLACSDSAPADETIVSLVKAGFTDWNHNQVGPVEKAWIIRRDNGVSEESCGPKCINLTTWITVGLNVQGDKSERKYHCQFVFNKSSFDDKPIRKWRIGVCDDKTGS